MTIARPLTATALCLVLGLGACTAETPTPAAPEVARSSASSGYSEQDFECLREAIYFEAAARSTPGQRAVANVILNRAEDPRFPATICGVVREGEARGRCQFSYRCDGRDEVFSDRVKLKNATRATRLVLENPEEDVTNGALYFHAASIRPGWFATLKRTVALGGNIFYRG